MPPTAPCQIEYSAPWVSLWWYWINIPQFSITISSPNIVKPIYTPPSLSTQFTPINFIPSTLRLNPEDYDLSVDELVFPIFNPLDIDEFESSGIDQPSISIPNPLDIPQLDEDPDYDILRKNFYSFAYVFFPYSINLPLLPSQYDLQVSDFDTSLVIPENELISIPLPALGVPNIVMQSDINANYLRRLGYENDVAEEIYISERGFFKKLFNEVERYSDLLFSIDRFGMFIDSMLLVERSNFLQHLTKKQRALLKLTFIAKKYKEFLQSKVQKLNLIMSQMRNEVIRIVAMNNALYEQWRGIVGVEKLRGQSYISMIKRNGSLYANVTKTNRLLRELFLLYVGLFRYIIEGQVLNLERERLIVDASISALNFSSAKVREELPNIQRDILLTSDQVYDKRLTVLEKEYQKLLFRSGIIAQKIDIFNKELQVAEGSLHLKRDKYNLLGNDIRLGMDLRLLENYLSIYKQMFNDYLYIMREYIQTLAEKNRVNVELTQILPDLANTSFWKLYYHRNQYYWKIVEAYNYFMDLHTDASEMIANANIKSTIIEAYS